MHTSLFWMEPRAPFYFQPFSSCRSGPASRRPRKKGKPREEAAESSQGGARLSARSSALRSPSQPLEPETERPWGTRRRPSATRPRRASSKSSCSPRGKLLSRSCRRRAVWRANCDLSRLYPSCPWDPKMARRLIVDRKIAPRFPGREAPDGSFVHECPICFMVRFGVRLRGGSRLLTEVMAGSITRGT